MFLWRENMGREKIDKTMTAGNTAGYYYCIFIQQPNIGL